MPTAIEKQLEALRSQLRSQDFRLLELLAADLFGRLLDVRVSVAKSGFQHGGDAGTTGIRDRYLRIECKRYGDTTPLDDRELQGEIDDAMHRTPGLEAWLLVSTTCASENTLETLGRKAREVGVPVIVFDWKSSAGAAPDLATLCAWAPDLVRSHYGKPAGTAAKRIAALMRVETQIARIRQDLAPWCVGYEELRRAAASRLRLIWDSDVESLAAFGQRAAGGTDPAHLTRKAIAKHLDAWWDDTTAGPAVPYGAEGVGKTWGVLEWIVRGLPGRLPMSLVLASSSLMAIPKIGEMPVVEFLAGELYGLTRTQDRRYWEKRLIKLLERPSSEGPALLILLDGVNQQPSFDWIALLQVMQGGMFRDKVRIVATTQTHFLEDGLGWLRQLALRPTMWGVEPFDLEIGGELDQALAKQGRKRDEFSPELLELARIPRLLQLVLSLKSEANLYGEPTVNTLLWAYGRDDLGLREQRAFSESAWMEWLSNLAQKHWGQIVAARARGEADATADTVYTMAQLRSSVASASVRPDDHIRRLGEIVDGTWLEAVPGAPHLRRPTAATINLALASELLSRLERQAVSNEDGVRLELTKWLDPVAGTSAAADILAAALSISIAKRAAGMAVVTSEVLTALLQSQNVGDGHRREVKALAPGIIDPLLDAIEHSSNRAQASARSWALESLRGLSYENEGAWERVDQRLVGWVARAKCPGEVDHRRQEEYAQHLAKDLVTRIGTDRPGVHRVLGVPVRLTADDDDSLANLVPVLLRGRALRPSIQVLVAAAVIVAIGTGGRDCWDGLRWVVLLNEIDGPLTNATLVHLSGEAVKLVPEPGLHRDFGKKVASQLLWLTQVEDNEVMGSKMRASFERSVTYENDYLPNPSRSWFALEHRHVEHALADEGVHLSPRLRRAELYLPDPALEAPQSLLDALEKAATNIDVGSLDRHLSHTDADHTLDGLTLGAARFVPRVLAGLIRRQLRNLAGRTGEARYWAGLRAPEHVLLVTDDEAEAIACAVAADNAADSTKEAFVVTQLLELELLRRSPLERLHRLVELSDAHLTVTLVSMLSPLSQEEIRAFVDRWGFLHERAMRVLLNYLVLNGTELPEEVFEGLMPLVATADPNDLRTSAFMGLASANSRTFGERLLAIGWKVKAEQVSLEQDYGSRAVLAAAQKSQRLANLRFTVAPWRLLTEARIRGGRPEDVKAAADALTPAVLSAFRPVGLEAEVSIDVSDSHGRVSVSLPEPPEGDLASFLSSISEDEDTFNARQRLANQRVDEYLTSAKDAGAVLMTRNFSVDDVTLLVQHCSAEVEAWLEGFELRTPAFVDKVNRAGGLFLAICEVLLAQQPGRGVALWEALVDTLRLKFAGVAGILELTHLPFRAPDSPQVLGLRRKLYSLQRNPNDKSYFELAVCVLVSGNLAWLFAVISEDETSRHDWRRMRGVLVKGFLGETPPSEAKWPEGPVIGVSQWLRRSALIWANRQGQAKYWWREFLRSTTPEAAYASWHVFLRCVDRRACAWMDTELRAHADDSELWQVKMLHLRISRSKLQNAMETQEKQGARGMEHSLLGSDEPTRWFDPDYLSPE